MSQKYQNYAQRLELLHRLDRATLAGESFETIAELALSLMQQLIPFKRATILLCDFATREATVVAARIDGPTKYGWQARRSLNLFEYIDEFCAKVRYVEDISAQPNLSPLEQLLLEENIRAYCSVPLIAQNELFGTLNLGGQDVGSFTPEHIEIAREIADQLTIALEQTRLREQLQQYAVELEQQVAHQMDKLAQERNFVSTILDTTGALIIVVDRQARIVEFNRACEQLTGYTLDEVKRKTFWSLLLPEEIELVKTVFEQLGQGQFPNAHENHWITRNGQRRLIAWSNTVLLDSEGNVEYIIGTGIDITERNQAEEALNKERNLLRTLIDNLPDYIYFKDTESQFITANKATVQIMNAQTLDNLIGKTDFDFYPEELANEYYSDEQRIIRSSRYLVDKEERLITSAGEKRWLLTTKVPLRNSQGEIFGLVGIGRDITERKQMEAEKDKLLGKVDKQRKQLRALTQQLAEAEEAERKQLAQELHDQVGSNLTALGLNLNIVQGQIPNSIPAANSIQVRLEDAQVLIEQTAERIRNIMANLHPPVLDDYGLVTALRWYSKQLAPRVTFTITVLGEEPDPRLSISTEYALFRITQEALTNVAKHAQADKVTIKIETDNQTVQLLIVDDGCGFDTAQITDTVDRPGWGLLTMVERAERLGGYCQIESHPKEGTWILVEMPQ